MTIGRLPNLSARGVLLALVSSIVCLAQSPPATVIGKFVGTWKDNESKRKIGSSAPGLRFRRASSGQLEELRGPDERPVVEAVNFDGKPYQVDTPSDTTIAWKQIDANHFERTNLQNGKSMIVRRIVISADGKTLTETLERKLADGRTRNTTTVYKRSAEDSRGLVGVWKPESIRMRPLRQMKIEALGTNGLKTTDLRGVSSTLTFDGKANPVTGGFVISGIASSGRLASDNTIEVTDGREGVAFAKRTFTLSGGGKTLTITTTAQNAAGDPSVDVYEKQ
jgi:hypothetical protein